MAFTEMSDTEMATSTLIQAIETSLNPSTDQQKRAEAYEVNNKQLFPTRNEYTVFSVGFEVEVGSQKVGVADSKCLLPQKILKYYTVRDAFSCILKH